MSREIRIATRRSPLALWQAEHVAARLRSLYPRLGVTLVPIVTEGDRLLDRSLAAAGGKGLFIKELESAMFDGHADVAVHSMKDMTATIPDGMTIAAVLERADARDALVSAVYPGFGALPPAARVGTSSLRRRCQLKHARPDLDIQPLRGNVDTRLRKLDEGGFDAIVLAAAGIERLGLADRIGARLPAELMLPAVGQGVIGIECRSDDTPTRLMLKPLEHGATRLCLDAERAFAARLGASCVSPVAGFAELDDDRMRLRGLVGSPDGETVIRDETGGHPSEAAAIGTALAARMLSAGAAELLERLRPETA